jgi:multiple sugar transport system substrate-binding protein
LRKSYRVLIIVFIFFLAGLILFFLNKYYPLDYLYNLIIKRDFAVNPRVEIDPGREYQVRIWYYPFYRTIKEADEREFFQELKEDLETTYPNIRLFVGEIDFATGIESLREAIEEGKPPDIYFNLSSQDLLEEKLQLAVSPYISPMEREAYYTVDWQQVSFRDRLWGWPVLVQRQYWIAGKGILAEKYKDLPFLDQLAYLEEDSLFLNYYDETLLKQLLTLVGLENFKVEKGELDPFAYEALEELFTLLDSLRERGILYKDSRLVPDIFVRKLLEDKAVVIGPVNPYLGHFISERLGEEVEFIYLDNLVKTYVLNVFRQRDYRGDDHSRAVMEVARIISQKTAGSLAGDLGLTKAYLNGEGLKAGAEMRAGEELIPGVKELLLIQPGERAYWEEVVWPAWLDFWEQDLSPEEVLKRL